MARTKKINVDIMANEIVEVKDTPVEEVKITDSPVAVDNVSELTVKVVKPKAVESDKARVPTPICDIAELTEEDKQILIEKKIKNILDMSQIGIAYALVRFKEPDTTAVPPMYALIEYDHRFVNEGWEFYKTNVRNPHFKEYLDLITRVTGKPNKIYPRLVLFNYE